MARKLLSTPAEDAMALTTLWAGLEADEVDEDDYFEKFDLLMKTRKREHLLQVIQYLAAGHVGIMHLYADETGRSRDEVVKRVALAKNLRSED